MSDSHYDSRTFTIQQVADDELKCSRAFVNKLLRTGKLEHSKVGSRVIIRGRAIRKLLDDSTATADESA
jgi:excisionase family DNA binding protein